MLNIIGIDIGGTHFRIGTVNESGRITNFQKLSTSSVLHSNNVLNDLGEFIEKYSSLTKIQEITALSIGFPATLNRERTKILQAPNLNYMENLPVVEYLSKRLNIPVFVERDVTMTLSYDIMKYHIDLSGIIIGIYFGTGVGNAIMIDGKFLTGKNGTAGELGHIPVDNYDEACGCGLRGCIENLAGGKYLAAKYPVKDIGRIFVEHARELDLFIERMAACVSIEVNILDPDNIVIGGGVVNMPDFPKNLLHEKILEHVRKPYPAENLKIIYAEDEAEKSVAGAAYYAMNKLRK